MKKIFLVLIPFVFALNAFATETAPLELTPIEPAAVAHKCETIALKTANFVYCFQENQLNGTARTDVVYYFHGIRSNAEDLFSAEANLVNKLSSYGARAPLMVGISIGTEGIFKTENTAEVLQQAFPRMEARLNLGLSVRRHLIGKSMGGHNVLRVAAEAAARFTSMAMLCPAVITFLPQDRSAISAYYNRHADVINKIFFGYVLRVYQREFPTNDDWKINDPMNFLAAGIYDRIHMFLSTGRSDSLGFFEGATVFNDIAKTRNLNVDWAPVPGAHCAHDAAALEAFELKQLGL